MNDTERSYAKQLRLWYREIKRNAQCNICGRRKKLEFHHLDGTDKRDTVSKLVHRHKSYEIIIEEMNKCEILCRSCHRKLHLERDRNK